MGNIRSIVAATDLSASAHHAAERAAQLARAMGASLTLVHATGGAVGDLRQWFASGDFEQALDAVATRQLSELACELQSGHGIVADSHVGDGHPVEEIVELANKLRADLVVTGARGEGLSQHVVGSTAERVVRASLRPVLLVRRAPTAPYKRILLPVDFSVWSELAIHTARRLFPDAHLVLLHAVHAASAARLRLGGASREQVEKYLAQAREQAGNKLVDLAQRAGLAPADSTAVVTLEIDPWTAIVQQEQEQACDLIVIGKQGRSGLSEFLLGSVTRMVLTTTQSDVLVVARSPALA